MRAAVVGGGINGVMTAWALARAGATVDLFERGRLMDATSAASTKLLHGGLRYLEHAEFRLVREGLRERAWWIAQAPHLAHPIRLVLPVYAWSRRPAWMVRIGLGLYGLLAGRKALGPSAWHDREALLRLAPDLDPSGLRGGFTFWDGQMDDRALGLWAAERAQEAGVRIHERTAVERVDTAGGVVVQGTRTAYDRVANVAGPWARALLDASGVASRHALDLVRGSHLLLARPCTCGVLAEVRGERRIAFVLPYAGRTLVGTTEERQTLDQPVACTPAERDYLIAFHNRLQRTPAGPEDVADMFAGLRPLLRSADDPGRATREYAIEAQGRLVSVFGGKWTTARALGERVAEQVLAGS
jgi:glycerol-3-phosphate dehydrogenase